MTQQHLLVINCGSSSLKYALYTHSTLEALSDRPSLTLVSEGLAEKLGSDEAVLHIEYGGAKEFLLLGQPGHEKAIQVLTQSLEQKFQLKTTLVGVGHRVVHGGEVFKSSVLIEPDVMSQIRNCIPLAPLHNPANLLGIELLQAAYPGTPQVAVFDTAFHQTMPEFAFLYAIPYSLYREKSIRRYGFHGTSHRYVTDRASELLSKPISEVNLITAHLGNGASVCAIKNGKSVDTSMGFTPLEGLVMGTRSGDLDPGIIDYLLSNGYDSSDVSQLLNKKSGLLGISEESNDMRKLTELADRGHKQAALAIDIFCFRLAKYIAAMMTSLDTLDALVFTGGIGENSGLIRDKTIARLSILGFTLDSTKNESVRQLGDCFINTDSSHKIMVVATDEEQMIAKDTLNII